MNIASGGRLTFRLSSVPTPLNLDLYLYDTGGTQITNSTAKGYGGVESMSVWLPAGDFFCLVYRRNGGSVVPYLLTVSFLAQNDPFEPNDTFATATPLISGAPLTDPWV